jgi:hypothetical protein
VIAEGASVVCVGDAVSVRPAVKTHFKYHGLTVPALRRVSSIYASHDKQILTKLRGLTVMVGRLNLGPSLGLGGAMFTLNAGLGRITLGM